MSLTTRRPAGRWRFTVAAALALLVTLAGPPPAEATGPGKGDTSPNRWIVTLAEGVPPGAVAAEHANEHAAVILHVYEHALNGYAARMSETAAARVAADPRVASVEADSKVAIAAQPVPTGINRIDGELSSTLAGNGSGAVNVDVAVIDTGIDTTHPDLNVVGGKNCVRALGLIPTGSSYRDDHGHGSHVAGTIAAKDDNVGVVGAAPGARLYAVKVLNSAGVGFASDIVCGIDWVTAKAGTIEVANMSLGGSGSEPAGSGCSTGNAQHDAICRSVAAGITYVVAAGNSSADASGFAPAAYDEVITVSALADFNGLPGGGAASTCRADVDDTFADFSNHGADVDVIAPGVCIYSTWMNGGYNTISGTSMASPHVAGGAALYKANNPNASPAQVQSALRSAGNLDWNNADDRDTTKEPLLNVATF